MDISISKLKTFKSCRRLYQLRYIEGLRPIQKAEALEIGSNYHKLLEQINNGQIPDFNDYSKEMAMAQAYYKYIYPNFKVVEAEKRLELDLGDGDKLVGIIDAIAEDGYIVEHKSTGSEITEQYEYNLLWDEQILAYMLLSDRRKVWYTVCRKPTIRQKQNETDEQFYQRMVEWYDTDTDSKIRLLKIERTDEEVKQFYEDLLLMREELKGVKQFYKNTCHCNMYGRRCEYSSICLNYDPNQQYIEFTRGEYNNGTEENSNF
jgi:hypothetical protein